ncbi:MAG TPA: polysaccharide deacetylase family protein [Thermoanaerobaculia bacterium]|nr:polysaccharide deacetylase family protein [Thermoanaerobaculia bacterium]
MSSEPAVQPVDLGPACCLTIDVEEWYHTCLVPSLVDPELRPAGLTEELDALLPDLLELLARCGRRATFFVLGEVARRLPGRVRQIAEAGHEVASHSLWHLRVSERSAEQFRGDAAGSRRLLEDLIGRPVVGFRAPEWSFRFRSHPHLPLLDEAGYRWDSSLAPYLGAGRWSNPRDPHRLVWTGPEGERSLLEIPPFSWAGPLHLPAGSWTGRLARISWVEGAFRRALARGRLAVGVVHPWEITGRPTPGTLTGFAGFVHETGREGYRERFEKLLSALPWTSIAEALTPTRG